MTYPIEIVKKIIKTFIDESIEENITLKGNQNSLANRSIFDIESFLVQLRNQYNINDRLDTSVVSNSILNNFYSVSSVDAFRPVDFQYNFLHHLAIEYRHDIELYLLIDTFIKIFKEQFTLADIVVTKTGATRCKTNIRFALNDLRDLSLVLSKDNQQKRCWGPSIVGLVTLINIQLNYPESKIWNCFKEPDSLRPYLHERLPSNYVHDPVLMQSLLMFREPEYLYIFLSDLRVKTIEKKESDLLNQLILDYIEFTQYGLEITPQGVKKTKLFKELASTFQDKLFNLEENNVGLKEKLFTHFRNNKHG